MPARVLLQDFTGVPVFVDLAAMREAAQKLGADPARINPRIPLDLVIDHSVIADVACCPEALERNMEMEFARNGERYRFLKLRIRLRTCASCLLGQAFAIKSM